MNLHIFLVFFETFPESGQSGQSIPKQLDIENKVFRPIWPLQVHRTLV